MAKTKTNVEAIYPLTPLQQGLLFHTLYAPESETYLIQFTYLLRGHLKVQALIRAWEKVLQRHAVLRTLFSWERGDKMLQVVRREVPLPWHELDWRGTAVEQQQARLQSFLDEGLTRGFDPSQAPLLRLTLIRVEDEAYYLIVGTHHLLLDGWSVILILQEVFAFYEAFARGEALHLEPSRPYKDYISWLQQQDANAAEQFWRTRLQGFTSPTPLPFERTRRELSQDGQKSVYLDEELRLPVETTAKLRQAARRHQLTLNTVVQGALALLLARFSSRDDVLFGSVLAGRPSDLAGVESMIGLFINALPVRVKVPGKARVLEWLKQLQQQQSELNHYEYSSLVQVQHWSDLPAGMPLFQTIYAFENYPVPVSTGEAETNELEIEMVHTVTQTSYPLTVMATMRDELLLKIKYDQTRLEQEAVRCLLRHLQFAIEEMLVDPNRRLDDIPSMTLNELDRLLVENNQTQVDFKTARSLHVLFEQQAERTPNNVALVCDGEELTYDELNKRANQLARYLQGLGVGPDMIVGICLERSVRMVVGLLGILKAGGAYLPLDLKYPMERLAWVMEDAQISVLLLEEKTEEKLPATWAQVVYLDSYWEDIANQNDQNLSDTSSSKNLAYVLYTSGSTGQPKGVMVTHEGVVNYLNWSTRAYKVNEGRGSIVHSPLNFDLTVTSLWGPLIVGKRVGLLSGEENIERLSAALQSGDQYSLIKLTPAHLQALAHLLPPDLVVHSHPFLIVGGEALWLEDLSSWRHLLPKATFVNEYGPTETVVGCCVYEVSNGELANGPVPIGRPIANMRVYLLNSQLAPVAMGVPGELYFGGMGVARGYLNRPDLTAESFVPDPFSLNEGERLYRTGDLARFLPDGNLEYLGRIDQQVKIRGFRVELKEIETVLNQSPLIKDSAVVVRADEPTQKRLVAYVVPDQKGQLAVNQQNLYRLPNNSLVRSLNKSETEIVYNEIFEERVYFKYGVTLRDGDVVFDVGANIGLFSLFVHQNSSGARVYAFEPMPPTFAVLRENAELHGLNAKLFDCGLSSRNGRAIFTFYPRVSVMSGAYADAVEDEQLLRAALHNQAGLLDEYADDLMGGRFDGEEITCQVRTLSDVISDEGIEQIDFLKIDAEKSELDVLQGIDEEDWSRIKQIVIEVHDKDGRLNTITDLLNKHGFRWTKDQEDLVRDTNLYSIFAVHPSRDEQSNGAGAARTAPVHVAQVSNKRTVPVELIREYLAEKLPDYMIPSAFVVLDELPLTANGKLDRRALPAPEAVHAAGDNGYVAPRNEAEQTLAGIWREVLRLEQVGIHDNFFELGGDSILSIQIIARANRSGLRLTPKQLFDQPSIAALAALSGSTPEVKEEQGVVSGAVRLTPIQAEFFSWEAPQRQHFNQAVMLRVKTEVAVEMLEQVLQELVDHHDALRLRFVQEAGEWRQHNAERERVSFQRVELGELSGEARAAALAREVNAAQESLNLGEGPLLRAVYFDLGDSEEGRLLLVIHHLAVDGVSWRILLEDLQSGYEQLRGGAALALPAKTTSYQSWAEQLWQAAQSAEVEAEASYWLEQEWERAPRLRRDYAGGENLVRSAQSVTEWLTAEETGVLLREVAAAYHTQINEVLLTALVRAFNRWNGERLLLVDMEGHGREEEQVTGVDLSRTVGWFTTLYPQLLEAEENLVTTLKRVKEQVRQTPRRGIGYGMLRHLNECAELREQMRALRRAEVSFNYLGQFDQVVESKGIFPRGADEPTGSSHAEAGTRRYSIEINGMVTGAQLRMHWTYSDLLYREETIKELAELYMQALREIINHSQSSASRAFTASDFPLAALNEETLGRLSTFLNTLAEEG